MGCPDETTLSHLLVGGLQEERRAQVLSHVEGCADCQRVLAAGEDSGPASSVTSGEADAGSFLARGATVSRYVVLERIGDGAMGVVYAAYDPELDRQVALKLLRPEGRQLEELRRRLLREAQSLARLSHPNVVAVHDVGPCGDSVFLALELVEGTTLADWMKEARPWREVLRVFQDAGRGLSAAHAAGLVHRDFKPANVLVGRDGRARVTDFGLARPSNRTGLPGAMGVLPASLLGHDTAPLTRSGVLVGTPVYMAPEQLRGEGADALSDQFSFCVALYEALYGVRPFDGRTLEELGRAIEEGRVRAPAREAKVPARVRRAVLRGLRTRAEERFPSMEALLAALTPRTVRVRTWLVASVLAVGLAGVTVDYVVSHRHEVRCAQEADKVAAAWSPERRERVHAAFLATGKPYAVPAWEKLSSELEAQASLWRTLRTEACLAVEEHTSDTAWQTVACLDARLWQLAAVTELLEKADRQMVQHAQQMLSSLEGLEGCKEAPALSTRPQPPDALRPRVDAARRRLSEAQARMEAGRYSEGLAVTTGLLQEIQGVDYRPLEAEVRVLHGQLHALSGQLKEAEESLYKAVWAAEAGRDDEAAARAWIFLIWVVGDQMARAGEVDRIVLHAQAEVARLGRERFPRISTELHLRMGGLLMVQGKLEQADAAFSHGLELARKTYGADSLRASYFLVGLGRVRTRQSRPAEALELYQQALRLRERTWGLEHPALALNLNNIAIELLALGRREEAIATWRRSLALLEASREPDHPSFAAPLTNLASVLRTMGHLDEARQDLERALAIFERGKGPDHPNTASALTELGMVAFDSQRLDEACAYHEQALARVQRALGPDTARASAPLTYLGSVHLRAGRYVEARRALTRALQLWEKEGGPDGSSATNALRPLARVELASGAPRKALEHCQRALALDERVQGAEAPDVALDLACLAEGHLALGAPAQAVPLLERARRLHRIAPRDPLDEAWATFLLARALGEQRSAAERARAVALAEEARTRMEGLGIRARVELRQVMAWRQRVEAP
ncbi:serine/threonine-protein kinase [Hyalangium gracile]|uniref:serine/threonine-protein kinase n=1 Tax=Hyalangium gracile TaxID=394092 RepID=UPI001CCB4C94|nr:serine/threonine-protein kinase [Hyalangium gracile]